MSNGTNEPAPPTVEAKPGKKVVVDNRPIWKKKRFIIPVALIALIVIINLANGGGDDSGGGSNTSTNSDSSSDESTSDSSSSSPSAVEDDESSQAEGGTRENPLPLGTAHSRDKGFTGTAWDISIDKIERVGLASFASSDVSGECVVVSGTATAQEVDTEDGLTNIYSFPEVHVIMNGADLGIDDELACDVQPPGYESYLTGLDMSVAEGGTVQWVKTFHAQEQGTPIDWVAIEETVYETTESAG